jgi:hypothetical protein
MAYTQFICSAHRVLRSYHRIPGQNQKQKTTLVYKQNDTVNTALNNIKLCDYGIDQAAEDSSFYLYHRDRYQIQTYAET